MAHVPIPQKEQFDPKAAKYLCQCLCKVHAKTAGATVVSVLFSFYIAYELLEFCRSDFVNGESFDGQRLLVILFGIALFLCLVHGIRTDNELFLLQTLSIGCIYFAKTVMFALVSVHFIFATRASLLEDCLKIVTYSAEQCLVLVEYGGVLFALVVLLNFWFARIIYGCYRYFKEGKRFDISAIDAENL